MDTILYYMYAFCYTVLFVWGIWLVRKRGFLSPSDFLLLVTGGLLIDNTVMASGRLIGEGLLMEGLHTFRFWSHVVLTPLLVVVAWDMVRRAGSEWAQTDVAGYGAVAFAIALIMFEISNGMSGGFALHPEYEYGVLRYVRAGNQGPPIMLIVVVVSLVSAGWMVRERMGWNGMLIGALLMVCSAIPLPLPSLAVTNVFELILIATLWATKSYQDRHVDENSQTLRIL